MTGIEEIPFFHSYDETTQHLTLRGAEHVPEQIREYADSIRILDVGQGTVTQLPDWLPELAQLQILFISGNPFTRVPQVVGELSGLTMFGAKGCHITEIPEGSLPTTLQWLILTHNKLAALPSSIGRLQALQKVSLAGNRLKEIPKELLQWQKLQLLRLGANQLRMLPEWLLELPELAWYGDAGNPGSMQFPQYAATVPVLSWQDVRIIEQIGASPSSTVYSAELPSEDQIAVKVYVGEYTSDGYAIDDMRACLAVGAHPNVTSVVGRIADHPEGYPAIAMRLIDASYSALGLPPNFTTIARDSFSEHAKWNEHAIEQIARTVAQAAEHMHAEGVQHGDLYAHNIVSQSTGVSVLGDFGAASAYDPLSRTASLRQACDVKAFGFLLDDLISRSEVAHSTLLQLREDCLRAKPSERPTFSGILELLAP